MEQKRVTDVVCQMIEVMRMHKTLASERVESLYPHRTAHMVLMYLSRTDACASQKELADRFYITPAAVTGILKKLEQDGYIERVQGDDNRYNEVKVTELGKRVVEDSFKMFSQLDTSLFEGFSDSELDGYIRCLTKIQENIRKRIEGAEENRNEKMV